MALPVDDFLGSSLDAQWTEAGSGTATVGGGLLTLNGTSKSITTVGTFDFTGQFLELWMNSNSEPDTVYFNIGLASHIFPMMRWNGGKWDAGQSNFQMPGNGSSWANITSGSGAHKIAYMAESGGVITFKDSDDGIAYNTIATPSIPRTYTAVKLSISVDAASDFKFESVGVVSSSPAIEEAVHRMLRTLAQSRNVVLFS